MCPEIPKPESARTFYDQLAAEYHLIFADWRESVRRQGEILDGPILGELGDAPQSVLDCTCGIGTQVIGLALHGHVVCGTDISAQAVKRALREVRMQPSLERALDTRRF